MAKKKIRLNAVEWAMRHHKIVMLIFCCLIIFGIYGLQRMNKNEFPDFVVRQGIVVAVYPGASAEQIEEQVTKPLEDYIFSYKEVKKSKTHSMSRDGIAIIQVELNDNLQNKDEFWSKFRHGVSVFKSELPKGVLALRVKDDFGDTSAMLVAIESDDKTYRELDEYTDELKDRLRQIESVGRMNVYGLQNEQIAICLDYDRLSHYGMSDKQLATELFAKNFTTSAGRLKSDSYANPIYVDNSLNNVHDIEELIVYSDPAGNIVRLKDLADVRKEYPSPDSYITNNGRKCVLLSIEMKSGRNIVDMGKEVKKVIDDYSASLPQDVNVYKITDQSKVVDDSVSTFIHELLIAIATVIIVVMLMLPLKVALIAATTIPVCIFTALGLFYAIGIELNTVTLAALMVTLGLLVDDSIVVIDGYLEFLEEGYSRWHASVKSAIHFFKSILSATLAISITFFPFLLTTKGIINDFLTSFPWAITIILLLSLILAELFIPFMQYFFIRRPLGKRLIKKEEKPRFSVLETLQRGYEKVVNFCFRHRKAVIIFGVASVIAGAWLMMRIPVRLMPNADRNQFSVEIYTPTGTTVERTAQIADSLETLLRADEKVLSVTSFKGCSSPRFHSAYAPQFGSENYAQFIVNTSSKEATEALLDEYTPKYTGHFPDAVVRFKQLCFSDAANPIEVRISGLNLSQIKECADSVIPILRKIPFLYNVRTDFNEPLASATISPDEESATRLGVSNLSIESMLAMRYGKGMMVGSVWEGDYDLDVVIKSNHSESGNADDLADEPVSVAGGLADVPLRQIATIAPEWHDGQIRHRNGIRTISVIADTKRGVNDNNATKVVQEALSDINIPQGVNISYGGEYDISQERMPYVVNGLIIAVVIIFFILVYHFKKIGTSLLLILCLTLCLPGTAISMMITNVSFSITCVLGIVTLMGILVRNGIIMIDYAEELRAAEHLTTTEAIKLSAKRRIRPIFLTSIAASMGVIPMVLGKSSLWMPMGAVILIGTLITMISVLTVLPVAYSFIRKN